MHKNIKSSTERSIHPEVFCKKAPIFEKNYFCKKTAIFTKHLQWLHLYRIKKTFGKRYCLEKQTILRKMPIFSFLKAISATKR